MLTTSYCVNLCVCVVSQRRGQQYKCPPPGSGLFRLREQVSRYCPLHIPFFRLLSTGFFTEKSRKSHIFSVGVSFRVWVSETPLVSDKYLPKTLGVWSGVREGGPPPRHSQRQGYYPARALARLARHGSHTHPTSQPHTCPLEATAARWLDDQGVGVSEVCDQQRGACERCCELPQLPLMGYYKKGTTNGIPLMG